jgi:hypothetical protein
VNKQIFSLGPPKQKSNNEGLNKFFVWSMLPFSTKSNPYNNQTLQTLAQKILKPKNSGTKTTHNTELQGSDSITKKKENKDRRGRGSLCKLISIQQRISSNLTVCKSRKRRISLIRNP